MVRKDSPGVWRTDDVHISCVSRKSADSQRRYNENTTDTLRLVRLAVSVSSSALIHHDTPIITASPAGQQLRQHVNTPVVLYLSRIDDTISNESLESIAD